MRVRKVLGAVAAVVSATAAVVLPSVSAQADSVCGNGWVKVQSYQGPAGGTFKDTLTRACIQKAASGECFAGDVSVYNGATNLGQYNNHYGSRYVRFGADGEVTCSSAWVLDNSPLSANYVSGYVYVGAWFWQAGMSRWQWGEGFGTPDSSLLN
jgi:hypothetical protein